VVPATAQNEAMTAMDRMRQALRRTTFDDIAPGLTVSFSAGVSECAAVKDLEAAIARADVAMYEAKRTAVTVQWRVRTQSQSKRRILFKSDKRLAHAGSSSAMLLLGAFLAVLTSRSQARQAI